MNCFVWLTSCSYSPLKKASSWHFNSFVIVDCWQNGQIPSSLKCFLPWFTQSALSKTSISRPIGRSLLPTITLLQIIEVSISASWSAILPRENEIVAHFSGFCANKVLARKSRLSLVSLEVCEIPYRLSTSSRKRSLLFLKPLKASWKSVSLGFNIRPHTISLNVALYSVSSWCFFFNVFSRIE